MNKRITSLLLCFVMVFSMLATTVPALAMSTEAPITVTIDPDKTTATPGDTITYTVNVGPVKRLQSVNFTLVIPEGLTYVSGKEVDGLKELLGADKAEYTDSTKTMIVSGGGSYNSDGTTALMKFSCTVNAGTVGATLKITFEGDEDFSDDDYETYDTTYDFDSSKVTVTAAPKPATGISLNKSTLELTVGESETLVATVEPADTTDTVTWDTGRSDVATVDSTGKVTAVAPGTAVIAARAGEKSAFCTVTVVAAPCTHTNKTPVSAKSSTCEVQGWDAYSKCNDCGQLFDKDGNAISAIPYLPLADHTPAQTATAEYLKSAATCTSPAVYYEHCSVCDVKLNATFTSGSTVPHTESGWKSDANGHWKECTVCGTITTTKEAHTPGAAATETTPQKCTKCDYIITPALGHTHTGGGGSYYAPVVPDMPMVYRGCTGDAVKTLQEKLNAKGFNSGNVDGIFGAKTYAAVTAFQKANSLGVDGIVGKLTWAKLYDATPVNVTPVTTQPMLRTGSRGDAVRKLQELLNAKGYTCGSVDGIFGSKTYAAVLAFQKANGLGADGIVGPLTWAKLG